MHQGSDEPIGVYDVSLAELYSEDAWHAPFQELRTRDPVHRVTSSMYGPYWAVTSYQAIVEVESCPDTYSSEAGGFTILPPTPLNERLQMFIERDPPVHTEQRKTVAPAFSPTALSHLAAEIRARTADVLRGLPVGTTFDWVARVSAELTTTMLATLLDMPSADRTKLTGWANWMSSIEMVHDPEKHEERLAKMREAGAYFRKIWEAKARMAPTRDLISMMAHSAAMGQMGQRELIGTMILLIVGGSDTTRNTMSGFIYASDKFPDERAKLEADPSLIANAVSETMRWQTPLSHMARTATRPSDLHGRHISEGDKLVLWYLSANRDEKVFGADADKWLVGRSNARRHLAFGHGIHRCVGSRLAELQVSILLEEMANLRLRVNVMSEPDRVSSCFVHGYRNLLVQTSHY